jgi:hypothetical protein
MDVVKGVHYKACLKSSSEDGAKAIAKALKALLKLGVKQWDGKPPEDGSNQILAYFTKKMVEDAKVEVKSKEAILRMETDISIEKLVASMLHSVGAE